MKERDKTSTAKRTLASRSGATGSSATRRRRLAFEPVEKRLLLSATEIEVPALRQEPVSESVVVPMITRSVEDVVAPPMKPMDVDWGDRPVNDSNDFEADIAAGRISNVHWELDDRGVVSGRNEFIPVPALPMEFDPAADGGFIDVGAVREAAGLNIPTLAGQAPLPDIEFADGFVDQIHAGLAEFDRPAEIAIVLKSLASDDGMPSTVSLPVDWWMDDAWGSREERVVQGLLPDGGLEFSMHWGGEHLAEELPPELQYSTVVRNIVDSWHSDAENALFFFPDSGSWFSGFRPPSEYALEHALAEAGGEIPDPPFAADGSAAPGAEPGSLRERHVSNRGIPLDHEAEAFGWRVAGSGCEADPFGAQSVFGSELASEAAVAVPVLVADNSGTLTFSHAIHASGVQANTAPADGGFIDVGLAAIVDEGLNTADVAGRISPATASDVAGHSPLPELAEAVPADAAPPRDDAAEELAGAEMPDALLSIAPESGVLVESDISVNPAIPFAAASSREAAHDAALEELAEGPKAETAGLAHFWAPAIFAVSALGRQAWKKKHGNDPAPASRRLKQGGSQVVPPPTVAFRMDEETDR